MFARRLIMPGQAFAPAATRFTLPSILQNPFVGPGLAVLGVLLIGASSIALLGDPGAGTPTMRAPLSAAGADGADRVRRLLGPEDSFGPPTLDALQPGGEIEMAGVGDLNDGAQAVITLPGGGRALSPPKSAAPAAPPARRYLPSPIPAAPLAGLSAPSPLGPLPVVAPDGRTSAQAYARPFVSNGKPKVALVIGGLGLNAAQTRAAIEGLPAEVTLSFVPYADGLQGWIDAARAQGHEVLLELPMEPLDFPANDPGPYTLMASAPAEETTKRLEWLLSRTTGYFGVTNYLGGKFLSDDAAVSAFMGAVKARGLAFVDDGSGGKNGGGAGGLPRASADRVVDDQLDGGAIERQLAALENAATARGSALGAGFAYPLTLEQAARWAEGLAARGYQLAPASAITRG